MFVLDLLAILGSWICMNLLFAFALRMIELQTAWTDWTAIGKITNHRGIQLVFSGSEEVKPGQFRSFQTGWTNGWMSSSFFITFSKPSSPWAHIITHPHVFGWSTPNLHIERCCTGNPEKNKATTLIEMFMLSHELTWRQPLTLYNSAREWMQVQNHAICVIQPNKCNDGFINIYPSVKPGNGKSPFVCYPGALNLHFWIFLMRISHAVATGSHKRCGSLFSRRHNVPSSLTFLHVTHVRGTRSRGTWGNR